MELTFPQFAERVLTLAKGSLTHKEKVKNRWGTHDQWVPVKAASEVTLESRLEGERIHVGGTSGGSCWDEGESHHDGYTVAHGEIEIECLETILADICPQMTFLQYKRLSREMHAEILETCENGYYGNSSDYQQKVVKMGDLYAALLTIGVITE